MADQERFRKLLKELWEKIQNMKDEEEEAKKELPKRIQEMDKRIENTFFDLHFDSDESTEVHEKSPPLVDWLLLDFPQLPAFAHEWSGEGSSSTDVGDSSSAAIGVVSSSAIAVDAGTCSSESSADIRIEGTEHRSSIRYSNVQVLGHIGALNKDSLQVAASSNRGTGNVQNEEETGDFFEDIIADIRKLFEEKDGKSNFEEKQREDRLLYYREPGLICVEALDENILVVRGYSGTGDWLSKYSHLLDCSDEYHEYKISTSSNEMVKKEHDSFKAGIEALKSQKKDLLALKEQDQSENLVDLRGLVNLQFLAQKLNVLINVCKRWIKMSKEQNPVEELELMENKYIQADQALGVMKLVVDRLLALEDEISNLQVTHIILVEKEDTMLKLKLFNPELEPLMQSTSKELGIRKSVQAKISDLLGQDIQPKNDSAFLLVADLKERKATVIQDSDGKHFMLFQMPNNLGDSAKATDKKTENVMALKTCNLHNGLLKPFWPAIISILFALAAAYVFAPAFKK